MITENEFGNILKKNAEVALNAFKDLVAGCTKAKDNYNPLIVLYRLKLMELQIEQQKLSIAVSVGREEMQNCFNKANTLAADFFDLCFKSNDLDVKAENAGDFFEDIKKDIGR